MIKQFDITITLNDGTNYKIISDGFTLNINNQNSGKIFTFDGTGEFSKDEDISIKNAIEQFDKIFSGESDLNYIPEPQPPEFMTRTQLKMIIKDSDIEKYFGFPDRSFYKYWVKNSQITSKWHFNKVVYLIKQNLIPIRFTRNFWNTYLFTKNDCHMQKYFIDLQSHMDELIANSKKD